MTYGFLLDTNVPSELARQSPEMRVRRWLSSQAAESLFLSVLTVGELHKGVNLLAPGKRRDLLQEWLLNDLLPSFTGRILPVTQSIANRWGMTIAERQRAGTPLGPVDGLIAATAFEKNLTLVTRNVRDMAALGVEIINPWDTLQVL